MESRNHSPTLPAAIEAYWAAANAGQIETAASAFANDAVVHDEGEHHRGPSSIRHWIEATTGKYQPVVEPLRSKETGGKHLVTTRVSGTFPGSPVELDYEFTLKDGKILSLEIK